MALVSERLSAVKIMSMILSTKGAIALPVNLDFSAQTTLRKNLSLEMQRAEIDNIQSIWIDNADGTAPVDFWFYGCVPPQRIRVEAYHQALLPVFAPEGVVEFRADCAGGVDVPIMLFNCPFPYFNQGPIDGVLVTPSLTRLALNSAALTIGDNILVAGVAAQTIRVYRLGLSVDQPTNLKFYSGSGAGTLLYGTSFLTAGGSLTMQASGVPWMVTAAGDAFVMTSSAAAAMGGQLGYVQS